MVTPLKMVALAPMVAPRLISVFSYRQLAQLKTYLVRVNRNIERHIAGHDYLARVNR